MIHVTIGDLFESGAQTLVNTVNCVGVMGKGVALEFKRRFPAMYADYVQRCQQRRVRLGEPYLYKGLAPPWILNFPTKDHWRSVSRLSDIVRGLEYLEGHYRSWGITSLAVPPLGCGQGQLEWRVVGRTLYRHLRRLDIPVHLYAPHGTPLPELDEAFLGEAGDRRENTPQQRIPSAWVALVEILARIDREPYHWPVGRTTFQKIAYFATESGIPTGLTYTRGSYGPFAADLKPLITRLVNNGLIQEVPLGSMLSIRPGPTYEDAVREYRAELQAWEAAIEAIADLFLRMQTRQAEIAATVHFAARSLRGDALFRPSENEVLQAVQLWKQRRKPPLNDEDVARAIRNLNVLGWLELIPSGDLPLGEPEDELVPA